MESASRALEAVRHHGPRRFWREQLVKGFMESASYRNVGSFVARPREPLQAGDCAP
jgi:hypothetical protein